MKRQAHSGLFQFLPLGLRIQEKLERLLDKHMVKLGRPQSIAWPSPPSRAHERLGASKISLSTFSSEELWEESGRLHGSSEVLLYLI